MGRINDFGYVFSLKNWFQLVTCILICYGNNVFGQTPEGFLQADSLRVETGNNFTVRIVLDYEDAVFPAENLDFTYSKHTFLKDNVLYVGKWEKGSDQWIKEIHLIYFDSGTYVFPPVRIPYAIPNGTSSSVHTDSLMIEVYNSPVIDARPEPIKDIQTAPPSRAIYWVIAALLLALCALGYALYRYIKHRNSKQIPKKVNQNTLAMPPKELALKRLGALKAKLPLPEEQIKPFYTELSDLLREYFEHRYNMPALEMTSGEILEKIKGESFPADLIPVLHRTFVHCDMVKFAKGVPPQEYHLEALEDTGRCVT